MTVFTPMRTRGAAAVLALPLLLTGCGLLNVSPSPQIDPPPAQVEAQMLNITEPTASSGVEQGSLQTVYVQNGQGLLVPVAVPIPATEDTAIKESRLKNSLAALVKNGPLQSKLPAGFSGVLPEGTEVKEVSIEKNESLAVVEFTKPFTGYEAKDERKIMEAVIWTLTEDPDVKSVEIWVDGQRLGEMPVDHTPLTHPLNRAVGINLELDNKTDISQTRPVTIYFTAATQSGDAYFVPVTRLIPTAEDPIKAALGQLTEGPAKGDGLEQVLTQNTLVEAVETSKDGIVTVSLRDDMFGKGEKAPSQMLQSIVLTVTENIQGAKVRIRLNDSPNVVGSDNLPYGDPVAKPQIINHLPA